MHWVKIIHSRHRDIVFLSETLVYVDRIDPLTIPFGFEGYFSISKLGRGGLALLWRKARFCKLLLFSSNFIYVEVHEDNQPTWRYNFEKESHV